MEKLIQLTRLKLRPSVHQQTNKKVQKQSTHWENAFATHITDKQSSVQILPIKQIEDKQPVEKLHENPGGRNANGE